MNPNYNSPYSNTQGRRSANQLFGFGNPSNLRSYVDQALSSAGVGANNFPNSFQQQLDSGNLQAFFRQWSNANPPGTWMAGGTNAASNNNNHYTSTNAGSSVSENMRLKMELLKLYESLEFRTKLQLRQQLPVMRQKSKILQAIREHQVVLIVGDEDCGKSSQVPQLILDEYIFDCAGNECRIVCAELTKISALTLATRVACDRNESLGKSVGFHFRGESCLPRPNGSILYCTNGILLKELRKDPLLKCSTVCVLDNINEVIAETKQIMGLLKLLLPHRPDLKIILLSNCNLPDTFYEYFRTYHILNIQETASVVDLTSDDISGEDLSSDDVATIDSTYAPVSGPDKTEKQKAKVAYNKARAFIKKHRQLDPALLTAQQKQMIIRHKKTVESFERTNPPKTKNRANTTAQETFVRNNTEDINSDCRPSTSTAGVTIKRTISMDEPFVGEKRSRYGDVNDDDTELQIAVIDLSDEKGRISEDQWMLVEAKLIFDMTSEKWSKDEISFESVNWYRGIKVITCRNKRSLEFLKIAIAEGEQIWPNTKLKVVPRSTIPTFNYATVWIPPPIPPMEKILHLIKKQNDGLNTENWKIVPSPNCKKNFGKEFRLLIDGNSIKHIRESQCRIKFGLGSIRIRLHGY